MAASIWDGITTTISTSGNDIYAATYANSAYFAGAGNDTLISSTPYSPVFLIGGDGSDTYILDGLASAVIAEYGTSNSNADKIVLRNIPLGSSWDATIIDGRHLFVFAGGSGNNNMDLLVLDFFSNVNTIDSIVFESGGGGLSGTYSRNQLISYIQSRNVAQATWAAADSYVLDNYLALNNLSSLEVNAAIAGIKAFPNYPTPTQFPPGQVTISGVNVGSTEFGYALKNGAASPLFITNAGVVATAAGGWTALAAAASATGYDLYWKNINGSYAKWVLNSSAALTGGALLSTAEFLQAETTLDVDLDTDGTKGLTFTTAKTVGSIQFGSTQLGYALKNGAASPLFITNAGVVATAAGGWTALAAAASATGYDLYWKNINGTYAKWVLNSSAALTGGALLSTAEFLQAETTLDVDLDTDGTKGLTFTTAKTVGSIQFGSTQLGYALKNGAASPLFITNAGVVATAAGGWTALAAAASATGYDLYWKNINGTYAKWVLNSSAALTGGALLSTAEFLQAETTLDVDLDTDGTKGLTFTPTKTVGSIQFGSTQLGYALKNGAASPLSITNAGAVATAAGGWTAIAAAASATGYDLYWKNINGTYAKWVLNSSAALTGGALLSTAEFLQAETTLDVDLDTDGTKGLTFTTAKTVGSIQFGSTQLGYALKNGAASPLFITNAGVVATAAGGWTALAAAASATGYDLYWKNINGTYAKWVLNSSAALTGGALLSTAEFLQAETTLDVDLDTDGTKGLTFTTAKTVGSIQFGSTQLGYALKNGAASPLSITNAGAVATAAGGWTAIAAAASATGYDLYWKNINGTYAKWVLNSSAALTGGALLSTAEFLQAETTLDVDLDTDGTKGLTFTTAKTVGSIQFGSTQLGYALKNGAASPLFITNAGAVATAAGGWTALAAAASATGYDLYWKNINGTYAKWVLNSSAALTGGALLSTAEFLQAETTLDVDLDTDGTKGLTFTTAKTVGSIQFGSTQLGYALKNGAASPLFITNAGAVATAAGGWTALAAAASATGYDLYWKNINGTYAKWVLNSSAALTGGALLSTAEFLQAETTLDVDLDSDGSIGSPLSFQAIVLIGTLAGSTSSFYTGPNSGETTTETQTLAGANENLVFTASSATSSFESITTTYFYGAPQPTTFLASYSVVATASENLVIIERANTNLKTKNYTAYTSNSDTYAGLTTYATLLNLLTKYSDLPADSNGGYISAVNIGFEATSSLTGLDGLFKQIDYQIKSVYKYLGVEKAIGLGSKTEQILDLNRQFALDASFQANNWFSTQLWIQELTTTPGQDIANQFQETNLRASSGLFLANAHSGPAADVVTGNQFSQKMYGTGNQNFNFLDSNAASAIAATPQIPIYLGTVKKDLLTGTGADEIFIPLGGDDTITMGGGKDLLVLASTTGQPKTTDFSNSEDKIFLSNKIYKSLSQTAGALDLGNFVAGSAPQDGNDYIFYDQGTGGLFYDEDGNGARSAIQIATLGSNIHPVLSTSSFIIG